MAPFYGWSYYFYLYDVQPSGGAFTFWPGSHHTAHRYFRQNPALVDGSFLTEEGFSWHSFCANLQAGAKNLWLVLVMWYFGIPI